MRPNSIYPAALCCLALAIGACTDSGGPPSPPEMTPSTATTQTGNAGGVVGSPAVRLGREDGSAIARAVVTFTITGGGTLATTVDTTSSTGLATAGEWRLANTPGTSTITATSPSAPGKSVVFTATGAVGPAAVLVKNSTFGGRFQPGAVVNPLPAVTVQDAVGNPVVGVPVTFAVTEGGGTATGLVQTTDGTGVATVGSWSLGSTAGQNTMTASVAGLAPVSFGHVVVAPTSVTKRAGDGQYAQPGATVAMAPSVTVLDNTQLPSPGVTVTFAVTSGGGSATGLQQTTDANGVATVGSWTLGTSPGANHLTATVAGLPSVTFTATVVAPAAVVLNAGNNQTAAPSATVPVAPSVIVLDQLNAPEEGVLVTFSIASGGGSVTGATARTNAQGVATVGSWQLGALGNNQLTAVVEGLPPVTFLAVASGYNIELRYRSSLTARQRLAFEHAVLRWSRVITGDQADVALNVAASESGCYPAMNESVDDLVIFVDVAAIDGGGGILGQAGPCLIRGTARLTLVGTMQFDNADLANMEANGTLDDVILHEMGHVLGIGTLWTQAAFNLLVGGGTSDPYFTGANARTAFANAGGSVYTGIPVPVENTGGTGTRDGHWRETIMRTELMTGYISSGGNAMSRVTIGSLQDMGYVVNMAAADAYVVPGSTAIIGAPAEAGTAIRDVLLTNPDVIGPDGRITAKR